MYTVTNKDQFFIATQVDLNVPTYQRWIVGKVDDISGCG